MKKKVLSIVLVLSMLCAFMPFVASAEVVENGTCGENLTWTLDDDGTLTISGTGDMYDWSDNANNSPFHIISDAIKTVVIKNGVTNIGGKTFYCCKKLTSIEIPNSVTSIGDSAFGGCWSLTGIEIPDSVTSIGTYAFRHCADLTSINVNKDNTKYCSVGGNLFSKDKTELIQYATGKTEKSYIVPDGVKSIGDGAFEGCDSLTSIEMPSGVTSIGAYAFCDCYNLTSVELPSRVTSIGEFAFWCCTSLTIIKIPSRVTSIGDGAFIGCGNLTSIEIPSGVTSIGFAMFKDCDKLTSIKIPSSVTIIGDCAFYYCISLTDVYYGGTKKQWDEISIGYENYDLENATIHCLRDLPMTTATITKSETSEAYTFSVEPEEKYEDCYVYAAMYDENGLLTGFNCVPLETTGSTNISVDKTDNAESAKVFILSDMLQPVITTQQFTIE